MSVKVFGYSTETDNGLLANGWQLHVELFGLVIQFSIAR